MKTSICITLFFMCLIIYGCDKTKQTKFKGRVVSDLNGEALKGADIHLHQRFDTGVIGYKDYGNYLTDENGDYEFVCDIEHHQSEDFYCEVKAKDYEIAYPLINMDGKSQLIIMPSKCRIGFHIKNINPVDTGDLFRRINLTYFYTSLDTNSYFRYADLNIKGTPTNNYYNIVYLNGNNKSYYYNYQYRKGNIEFTSPFRLITINALNTTYVDIYY